MKQVKMKWLQLVMALPLAMVMLMNPLPAAAKTTVALPFICAPSTNPSVTVQVMVDLDSAYVYGAANWQRGTVGRVLKWQCFDVTGRSSNLEWLLVPYGASQAWVHGNSVRVQGDITKLPVADDVVTKVDLVKTMPQGLPTVNWHQRYLYQASRWAGRDTKIFTVIGDCNAESQVYLGRFASGGMDTSSDPKLAYTVNWFTNSFSRTSVATHGSFNAAMAFDSTWSDPQLCGGDEGPLACELRLSKASILIVAIGTGDQHDWQTFEDNYRAIIRYTLGQGVLPVLMTKADALDSLEGGAPPDYINNVIRKLGVQYNIPVIDFSLATRTLPNNGLTAEQNNAQQSTNPFHLNDQGMDMRIFMTLETLKAITGL